MQAKAKPQQRRITNDLGAAEYLGLSIHTVRKDRVGAQRIPFYRIGSAIRYDLDRIDETLAELEVGGLAARPARRAA